MLKREEILIFQKKTLKKVWMKRKGYYLCRPVMKRTSPEKKGLRKRKGVLKFKIQVKNERSSLTF